MSEACTLLKLGAWNNRNTIVLLHGYTTVIQPKEVKNLIPFTTTQLEIKYHG
jgi:hypothetical protein